MTSFDRKETHPTCTMNTESHTPFEWCEKEVAFCFYRYDCYDNAEFIIIIIVLVAIVANLYFQDEMVCTCI